MTEDNSGDADGVGNPGPDLEPADVIKCRECGNMVRRVNQEHLRTDRCRYVDTEEASVARYDKDDRLRKDHPETLDDYKEKYPDAPTVSPRLRQELAERASDEDVAQRRRELIRARWRGEEPGAVAERLAEKYGVAESTVKRDWRDRGEWIGRVFGVEDAEAVVLESIAQKKEVREQLLRLGQRAADTEDINAAVRAMKAADSNIDDTIEHLRKLGEVASAADEKRITVEGEVDVDHDHTDPGESLDEDTLEKLDALTTDADGGGAGGDGGDNVINADYREVN